MREPPELHSQQHPESGWHASSELGIGFWGARTCLGAEDLGILRAGGQEWQAPPPPVRAGSVGGVSSWRPLALPWR